MTLTMAERSTLETMVCQYNPALWVQDVLHWEENIGAPLDSWQIDFLNNDGRRLLLNCCRQSGKSTVAAAKGLHRALLFPYSLVLLVSPSQRQSSELFRKVTDHIEAMDHPPKRPEDNKLSCTFENHSRIVSLPGEEKTIRGYSNADLIIEDEAARVKDDLNAAIRPMLAVSRGQLIEMSTPFGKRGHFFEAWENGGEAWSRTRITWQECPRITSEFIQSERHELGDWWVQQEYECEFVQTADQIFPYELVMASISDEFEPLFRSDI